MKKAPFALSTLLPLALTAALCFACLASQRTLAQRAPDSSHDARSQRQSVQIEGSTPASRTFFNGKIVKSGNRLVLLTADATYQLDEPKKACDFLNKDVRVAGVLDDSTGTIHLSSIGPA